MDTPAHRPPEARQSIFRNTYFRRFWTSQTISVFGSTIGGFAFSLVAADVLGATTGQMGLILALGRVPDIALGLFAGAWVDRVPRRRMLIAIDIALALIVASVPLLYALDQLTIYWLYAEALLFGTVETLAGPAWNAFLPSLVEKNRLVDANSKVMLSWSSSGLVGPGIAGVLVEIIKAPATMLVDAASFIVSAVMMARIRVTEMIDTGEAGSEALLPRIGEGLRRAFLDPMQRAVTAPRAILDFVDAMSLAVFVIYVLRAVELSPALLGVVFGFGAAGLTIGSVMSGRIERRWGAGPSALFGLILVGISPFTMILADATNPTWLNIAYLGLPGVIGGFGGMVQHVMLISIRQTITPSEVLGRVHSSVSVLRSVMAIGGAVVGGWLGEIIGLRPTIAVVAVAYTIPVWYSLLSPLRTASTREEPEPSVSVAG